MRGRDFLRQTLPISAFEDRTPGFAVGSTVSGIVDGPIVLENRIDLVEGARWLHLLRTKESAGNFHFSRLGCSPKRRMTYHTVLKGPAEWCASRWRFGDEEDLREIVSTSE